MTKSNHSAAFIPTTSSEVFCRVPIKEGTDIHLSIPVHSGKRSVLVF